MLQQAMLLLHSALPCSVTRPPPACCRAGAQPWCALMHPGVSVRLAPTAAAGAVAAACGCCTPPACSNDAPFELS